MSKTQLGILLFLSGPVSLMPQSLHVNRTTLRATEFFRLDSISSGPYRLVTLKGGPAGTWLIAEPKVPSNEGPSIYQLDPGGKLKSRIPLPGGSRAMGLTITPNGAATLLAQDRAIRLLEYDTGGKVLRNTTLGCASLGGLITIDNDPATVCPDGTVRSLGAGARQWSSWARPGTVVELMDGRNLVAVDQSSGQAVWSDLDLGVSKITNLGGPELEAARIHMDHSRRQVEAMPKPVGSQIGKGLTVMDTAADAGSLYVLVWPYHRETGPAVLRYSASGELIDRYFCPIPPGAGQDSFHQIEVTGNRLLLGSTSGRIVAYSLTR